MRCALFAGCIIFASFVLACTENEPAAVWPVAQHGPTRQVIVYLHVEGGDDCRDLVAQLYALPGEASQEWELYEEWIDEEGDAWIGPVFKWQQALLIIRELGTVGEESFCFAAQRIHLPKDLHVYIDL